MDFSALRRRTTDLLQSLPQSLPTMHLPSVGIPNALKSPSHVMKGSWEKVEVPPIKRSSHSVDVISGKAYIFGGEIRPREPVDNAMHVVNLPLSLSGSADYYIVKAVPTKTYEPVPAQTAAHTAPAQEETKKEDNAEGGEAETERKGKERAMSEVPLESSEDLKGKGKEIAVPQQGDVPAARVSHATAVIGSRIFLFGGRGGPDMAPLEEGGRVWVFDTRTNTWSYLDPAPPAVGAVARFPPARSYHCAAATDKPNRFPQQAPKRAESWTEWAVGDSAKVGIPQAPIVGNVAAEAVDEEYAGYGTFFILGGCLADGERTNDFWAFNVRTKVWAELPGAPGPACGGTAICISKSRLFRFGGFDGKNQLGGQIDYMHLEVETFDDGVALGEVGVTARGGWETIAQGKPTPASGEIPVDEATAVQEWPGNRSVLGFEAVTVGGGREYLLLTMGEKDASSEGHAGAGKFWDDVWVFQVPPLGMTAASVRDAMWQAMGHRTGEGQWSQVLMSPYDDDNSDEMPAPRGWIATAPVGDLEETAILVWGGLGQDNKRLGDGWILRLG
jgi:hypothetical protein